jgi:hypothetical protein
VCSSDLFQDTRLATKESTEGTAEHAAKVKRGFELTDIERKQGLIGLKDKGFRDNADGSMDVYDAQSGTVYQTDKDGNAVGYRDIREVEGTPVQDIKKQDLEMQGAELRLRQARQSLAESGVKAAEKRSAEKLLDAYSVALGDARRESDPSKKKELNIKLDQMAVNLSRYGVKVGGGLWPDAPTTTTVLKEDGTTEVRTVTKGGSEPSSGKTAAQVAAETKAAAAAPGAAPANPGTTAPPPPSGAGANNPVPKAATDARVYAQKRNELAAEIQRIETRTKGMSPDNAKEYKSANDYYSKVEQYRKM